MLGAIHKTRHQWYGEVVNLPKDDFTNKDYLVKGMTMGVGGQKSQKMYDVFYERSLFEICGTTTLWKGL